MADGTSDKSIAVIKTCKKCKNHAQSGLKCIKCETVSHVSCAKLLKNVIKIDDKFINCCEGVDNLNKMECNGSLQKSSFGESHILNLEISHLKELLLHKDQIIDNQRTAIVALQEQVRLLDIINNDRKISNIATCATSLSKGSKTIRQAPSSKTTNSNISETNKSEITLNSETDKSISIGKVNVVPIKVNKQSIDIKNTNDSGNLHSKCSMDEEKPITDNNTEFTVVSYKKRPNRVKNAPIVGELELAKDNSILKAIERVAYLHVFKLHPSTTTDEVIAYLRPSFPEVECEQLKSVHPEIYSSFKVTIKSENRENAMNPAIWPKGTCVNRFFHRKLCSKGCFAVTEKRQFKRHL
ncbi:hypothetical protein RI129_002443 [Pyrocoelia pectoralis]|uniref:Uncharacterized protein n=1 Tax=Pyrocoelia pectoralis TaxID=417401 RepID=A0AAN7VLX5_9COLE